VPTHQAFEPGVRAQGVAGSGERELSAPGSRVQLWAVPTNEEIVVARQARDLLQEE